MAKVIEVYLDEERWNPVCQATIPAAWVAEVEGCLGIQAFAHDYEYSNIAEAKKAAIEIFSHY